MFIVVLWVQQTFVAQEVIVYGILRSPLRNILESCKTGKILGSFYFKIVAYHVLSAFCWEKHGSNLAKEYAAFWYSDVPKHTP